MIENNRTFFITGATGYLGSCVARALIARGDNLFCLKRKTSNLYRISDLEAKLVWLNLETLNFNDFFLRNHIDGIIHCATDYGRKVIDPIQTIEANLTLPLKLLNAAGSAAVPFFINTDTILDKGISNYSLSKAQFSEWLNCYSNKIVGINLALQHFYGPGDDPTKFTTSIVRSLLESQDRIKLTGGEQQRDFIYIDDVVNAILTLTDAAQTMPRAYYRYELGSGKPISIRGFVDLVKEITQNNITSLDYGALPYRKGETMETTTDISGMSDLGWQATTDLREGLLKTIKIEKSILGL
jgi:nucleoside-diphosphate-sugar epimerase